MARLRQAGHRRWMAAGARYTPPSMVTLLVLSSRSVARRYLLQGSGGLGHDGPPIMVTAVLDVVARPVLSNG